MNVCVTYVICVRVRVFAKRRLGPRCPDGASLTAHCRDIGLLGGPACAHSLCILSVFFAFFFQL